MKRRLWAVIAFCVLALCPVMAQEDYGLLIFNHQICDGMTFANVQAAWGRPANVHRHFSNGVVIEYWFYNSGWMVEFDNGRVTGFSQSN